MKICVLAALFAIGIATNFVFCWLLTKSNKNPKRSLLRLFADPTGHKNWNLIPHDICGQVSSVRIIGGVEAPMNAYPWIARIGYSTSKSTELNFLCGGVVVNSRVVVTAAHCVTNLPNDYKVEIVRLGEHNTETNPDCENDFCAEPVVDMEPSEILIPDNYNTPSLRHDIALIRFSDDIKFSTFIKPICLLSGELLKKNYVGSTAEVAGWGIYDIDRWKSSVKLQVVKLPLVSNAECRKYLPRSADLGPTQMCAGGIIGKDSCGGDSGGPLMKVDDAINGPRYYLLGIVSFGPKKCAKSRMPGIYTKISSYTEWILNNLVF